jgi:GTP-binding protein
LKLISSASSVEEFLPQDCNEVAFIGRSNVGKSSLINAINDSHIVKVEDLPGSTKTIDFYTLTPKLRFIDMPGYGYTADEKMQKQHWPYLVGTIYYFDLDIQLSFN